DRDAPSPASPRSSDAVRRGPGAEPLSSAKAASELAGRSSQAGMSVSGSAAGEPDLAWAAAVAGGTAAVAGDAGAVARGAGVSTNAVAGACRTATGAAPGARGTED